MKKLWTKPFSFLTAVTFLGAFNDNLFKLLVIFQLIAIAGVNKIVSVSAIAGALFVLPFIVASPFAGILADRFSKRSIILLFKCTDVLTMSAGLFGFYTESAPVLYAVLCLMSLQSALLSPSKSGILPEMVDPSILTKANGVQTAASFLAIITGTGAAAALTWLTHSCSAASIATVIVATAAALCASQVPHTRKPSRSGAPAPNPSLTTALHTIAATPALRWGLPGSALFLMIGAFVQLSIIPFGMLTLGLNREMSSYIFLCAALGIGGGALFAGRLSRNSPNLALVPLGSAGMAIGAFVLAAQTPSAPFACGAMTLLGFFGGMFIVPIHTLIQTKSPSDVRGSVLALSNMLDFTGVLLASGLLFVLQKTGMPINRYFWVVAAVCALIAALSARLGLYAALRLTVVSLVKTVYRFRVREVESIPRTGGALLVFNHSSWIDPVLASAASPRPIRFLMDRARFNAWYLKPIARLVNVIPVAQTDRPHALSDAITAARRALENGDLVGIFPEGKIVIDGFLARFQSGYRKIVDGLDVPVIPAHIDGAWGSGFSYFGGRLFGRRSRSKKQAITIRFGQPLPPTVLPQELRRAVQVAGCATRCERAENIRDSHLGLRFVATARRNMRRTALTDTTGAHVTFGGALVSALTLARLFKKTFPNAGTVGVMLPASVGGALVNVALTLAGKVPVNLNFTVSAEAFSSAIAQSNCAAIVTSRTFLAKLQRPDLAGAFVCIEDLRSSIGSIQKTIALLKACFVPASLLVKIDPERPATVIFSSGSTAQPKGIVLSHTNIAADLDAIQDVVQVTSCDAICGALPFFHSFGYTATMWFPLTMGFSAHFHPSPLDGKSIARLVRDRKATLLLATPTFLQSYMRRANRSDFASLRLVVAGGEKLSQRIADEFAAAFGIRPVEGYGATELSPIAALNLPDFAIANRKSIANKPGTIGRLLPGMAAKLVNPETGADLTDNSRGMLCIKGANVMAEYLHAPDKTVEAIRDGWYVTGDIASIDDDGFITLHDRQSRFSKIGGEMVPHGAVEAAVMEKLGCEERCVAVVAAPDEKRGERLVMLYDWHLTDEDLIRAALDRSDIPNLWKPDAFIPLEKIPLLGSGKIDLGECKRAAMERVAFARAA
jgi:acyl-[acyl-carrier-protein]-phospholipid O-acyltransferase / long-chain-fatty-acid--[acyl-carrier-protein] ligase